MENSSIPKTGTIRSISTDNTSSDDTSAQGSKTTTSSSGVPLWKMRTSKPSMIVAANQGVEEKPRITQDHVIPKDVKYASFLRRLLATIIDGVLLTSINLILILIIGTYALPFLPKDKTISYFNLDSNYITVLSFIVGSLYYIYFIGSRGQTPGKMLLRIKVVKLETYEVPGYFKAFVREIIGKVISSIFLILGYLWMLWDPKKQTWHDKLVGTVVIADFEKTAGS